MTEFKVGCDTSSHYHGEVGWGVTSKVTFFKQRKNIVIKVNLTSSIESLKITCKRTTNPYNSWKRKWTISLSTEDKSL